MSENTQWTIDDAQMNARSSLRKLDEVLGAILSTGISYEERILVEDLSEARELLARACQVIEWINPNGVTNTANLSRQGGNFTN